MIFQKYLSYIAAISLAMSGELVTFLLLPILPLQAYPLEISLRFPGTRNIGAPDRTIGSGQRGQKSCLPTQNNTPLIVTPLITSLTALTPTNNVLTTLLPNPSLYVYVPETKASSAEFTIVDQEGEEIYNTTLALKNIPGIVEVPLPRTVFLTPGKEYNWQFAVVCNPTKREQDQFVRGVILPTNLDLLSEEIRQKTGQGLTEEQKQMLNPKELQKNLAELKTKPEEAKGLLEEQLAQYNQVGIWSEILIILHRLSNTFPDDCHLTKDQQELFNSVDLFQIAEKIEKPVCQTKSQL